MDAFHVEVYKHLKRFNTTITSGTANLNATPS